VASRRRPGIGSAGAICPAWHNDPGILSRPVLALGSGVASHRRDPELGRIGSGWMLHPTGHRNTSRLNQESCALHQVASWEIGLFPGENGTSPDDGPHDSSRSS
jgi:hypothetical protein